MKVPARQYRCPLGKLQPSGTDLEALKERSWREQGLFVVSHDDQRLDWVERELLKNIAERLYGAARPGGHHG